MGLEQLQRLPTKAPSPGRTMMQTLVVLLGIVIVAFWIATQYAASKLGYQAALGEPLFAIGQVKIYVPFDFLIWLLRFGHVEGTEAAFSGGEQILLGLHFLFIPAIWLSIRRAKKYGGKTDLHGSAHWATRKEIVLSGLLPEPPNAMRSIASAAMSLVGTKSPADEDDGYEVYVGGWVDDKGRLHYLKDKSPGHVFAYAPTRSGKGVCLVLPTMLSWRGSSVVHDIKKEIWSLTAGWRQAIGHKVVRFEPTCDDGTAACFNPLEEIRIGTLREVADAQNIAMMVVDPEGKGMQDHWAKTGHELLSASILHVLFSYPDKTLRGVVSFFCDPRQTIEQVAESMLNAEHDPTLERGWTDPITGELVKTHPMVAEAARSFLNKSENERSGVQSTALSFLALYRDPIIAMNTSRSDFKVRDLQHHVSPVDLYLITPPSDKARTRPLFRLLLSQIVLGLTEKMLFANGRSVGDYKHRLLMMMDEFPALGKHDVIQESMAYVAGYGIKYYLIAQDLSQLWGAYTKDETIIGNSGTRVAFAPTKYETAEVLSKYCGTTTVHETKRNHSGGRLNPLLMHTMESENSTSRPLLTPDECMRLPAALKDASGKNVIEAGDMLVFPMGGAPIYGKQILYFKDPVFSGRSKIPAPDMTDRIITHAAAVRPAVHPRPAPVAVAVAVATVIPAAPVAQAQATPAPGTGTPATTVPAAASVPAATAPVVQTAPAMPVSVAPAAPAASAAPAVSTPNVSESVVVAAVATSVAFEAHAVGASADKDALLDPVPAEPIARAEDADLPAPLPGETEVPTEAPAGVVYTDEELRTMDAEYEARLNDTGFSYE
ncbi:type IV secretory system conjugative DNA transfer family protein [Cupriavidus pauculus]|uniref:type IV secretory system conjugative DNA transfer family protein n=1 Tax=Cupriavidus pauculus TaxID=82633 RepID=UPI0038577B90